MLALRCKRLRRPCRHLLILGVLPSKAVYSYNNSVSMGREASPAVRPYHKLGTSRIVRLRDITLPIIEHKWVTTASVTELVSVFGNTETRRIRYKNVNDATVESAKIESV
jgi:hypothetical protein